MKNLVQIICGCAAAETIEECARVPQMLGATVIVVHGLWPKYDYPTSDPNFADMSSLVTPTTRIDNVAQIAEENGWHFLQMQKFAYNGEQYNAALGYIRDHGIPCEHIWFVDADNLIDPEHLSILLQDVELLKQNGISSLRFQNLLEIVPGWRTFTYNVLAGNFGIVWGDALGVEREEYFDGNFRFKSEVSFVGTNVPLLHLHHFRKNAADRIWDGCWHGGGMTVNLETASPIYSSPYIQHLREKYPQFHVERGGQDSYVGSSIFQDENGKS
jgi:hypothetical protein